VSLRTSNLIYGGGYAEGAPVITSGKPKTDGYIDRKHPSFAKKMREQINWLNVNEPDVQAIVTSLTDKTMGVNINVQVVSSSKTFNREAEALLNEHGNFGIENGVTRAIGELTGEHHFNAFSRMISDFTILGGGIIVRHHYNTAWTIPYKYELIGVDMIDISKTVLYTPQDKETTINGIKRDKFGMITHLYLYTTPDKQTSTPVPYSELTYYSEVWMNIDQQTAVSKLTSILSTLDQSTQYGKATLQSAIEESKAGHYVKSTAYNELMKIVADEINSATNGQGIERINNAKDLVTPILNDMANLGIKTRGLTPIASEDEVQFNTSKIESQYESLTNNSEKKTSSALGLSDIGVYSKASDANYSSIKYTLETDQRTADIRFDNFKSKVFFDINSRIIRVGIQIGRISERVAYWKNPNKFNQFKYLRQNKIDTEPSKNAVANKSNISIGVKTEGDIVEEATGIPYDVFLERKHEQNSLKLDYEVKLEKLRKEKFKEAGIVTEEDISKDANDKMLASIHSGNEKLLLLHKQVNL